MNFSRNKFLLCFRPVLDSEGNVSRKCTARGPSATYISEHKNCSKSSSKKKFSRVIIKSKRERKSSSQDEFDGKLVKSFSVSHIQEIKSKPVLLSSQSSLRLSSSSSVSESRTSYNNNQERVHKPKNKFVGSTSSCSSSNYAISLLLISLAVTILWGKVCAILFTSIWFCFLPQQTNRRPRENVKEKIIEAKRESKDSYKKRIIMEGLLKRTTAKRVHQILF